jgi:diguanylate cyclase (GGDEF)-like protein
LEPSKLFVEASLLVTGWALAAAWLLDPLYGLATLLPLALIFQALHVPNLRREAATDPKTGLANSRYFNQMLDRELERARRSGQSESLLMCDLDYLRNINNTSGHQAGDIVLLGGANIIRESIRVNDVPGRFGGEEFCVLLADTDVGGARQAAERIRQVVEATPFPIDRSDRLVGTTVSVGVANCPFDGHTAETLLHEADLAVYLTPTWSTCCRRFQSRKSSSAPPGSPRR